MPADSSVSFSRLFHSWWVVLFCLMAGGIYSSAMKGRNKALHELQFQLEEMEKEKSFALMEKEELALRIASQNDPGWIELILLKELGVVPDGFLKVHFKK